MIPEGELLRSRVVSELSDSLEGALDRRLDGYAVLAPRDAILFDADGVGVITFEAGVPSMAYHTETDRGGPAALADIGAGPYRLELHELDADALDLPGRTDALDVPPGMPADRLAGDAALAERTRRIAADDADADDGEPDAIVEFLDDEAAIERIRSDARQQAAARADEWGFEDAI